MDFKTYRELPAVNFSTLKTMAKSPLHYLHAVNEPQAPPSDAMILGSATHKAVLEPDDFGDDFVVWTGARRAGKEWDAFKEASRVHEILTEAMNAKAWEISAAVRAHPAAARLLGGVGVNEHTIVWTDEATGLKCKGRADRIARDRNGVDVLIDLKTDRDPDPRAFSNTIAKRSYHMQMAFYRDGLRASGYDIGRVVLIVVESSPPFDVGVLELDEDTLRIGQSEYRALLAKVAECRASGEWPGRYPTEQQIELPGWYYAPDLDGDDDGADFDMEDM